MSIPIRRIPVLLVIALLAGCGNSPPVRYHALVPAGQPVSGGSAALQVEVMPIAIPERMNREELVLSGNGTELTVLDGDRWAAPLEDELRQALDDALWRRLRAADSYRAPSGQPGSLPQYRLALRIERFEAVPGRQALVDASWTARLLPAGAALVCRLGVAQPVDGVTPGASAAALSVATGRLVEKISDSIASLSGAGTCPE